MKGSIILAVFFLISLSFSIYGQNTSDMTGSSGSANMPTAQMTQMIVDKENEIMNAVKTKNIEQFKENLADDYVGVYDMGIVGKSDEVQSLNDFTLNDLSMSDQKVTFPTSDVAIITYKAKASGSDKGKDFSGTYNVTSTWVKRNGKWVGIEHVEVKAPSDQMK